MPFYLKRKKANCATEVENDNLHKAGKVYNRT